MSDEQWSMAVNANEIIGIIQAKGREFEKAGVSVNDALGFVAMITTSLLAMLSDVLTNESLDGILNYLLQDKFNKRIDIKIETLQ